VKVRFTRRALKQLSAVFDYIERQSPRGAENVKHRIHAVIEVLAEHPRSGRATNKVGYRRAVAHPYPYVIFYQPEDAEIVIHGVRHAARRSRD
jgi:toxin ParE1/3/4